jgi:hypothetical protein
VSETVSSYSSSKYSFSVSSTCLAERLSTWKEGERSVRARHGGSEGLIGSSGRVGGSDETRFPPSQFFQDRFVELRESEAAR